MEKLIVIFCCYCFITSSIKFLIFYYSFISFLFNNIKIFIPNPLKYTYFYIMSMDNIVDEIEDQKVFKKYLYKIINPFYLNFKKIKFIDTLEFLKKADREYLKSSNLIRGD